MFKLSQQIRNIFQHGHEHPLAMKVAFGTANPAPSKMMSTFFDHFQFLYLHSLSWFDKLFEARSDAVPQLYIKTYDKFETAVCVRGLTSGAIKPLKRGGEITLHFESVTDGVVTDTIAFDGNTYSCINNYRYLSQSSLPILRPKP